MENENYGDGKREANFKEVCFELRGMIEKMKPPTLEVMEHPDFKNEQTSQNQRSEMKANIKLAYRHLEDARMRIGKAIQAFDGGQSCYPR